MSAASEGLTERMKRARNQGGLFHPTNPYDSWFCIPCDVFGKGSNGCWSCGSQNVEWQVLPRLGGGAQNASSATTDNVV